MNSVNIIGRLTRDPELRTTTTGKSVCSFSLAVDRRFKSDDQPCDFLDFVAWERQADYLINYIQKGNRVAVEGRLQARKWTATDGSTRTAVEIVVNNVQGLDRPRDDTPERATELEPEYDAFAGTE